MGKRCCETFFQSGKKDKVMAEETVESLSIKFGMILEYLKEIKSSLNDLPCDDLGKDVAENAFEIKHLKETVAGYRKELDKEIYSRLRIVETDMATVIQQNKGQDAWSAKIWVFIMLGILIIKEIAMYFLTRG